MPDILKNVYDEWRQHHRECPQCGEHDWYNPGMPRLAKEGEEPHKLVETRDGRKVGICWSPDLDLLCSEGALLFRMWLGATVKSDIFYR